MHDRVHSWKQPLVRYIAHREHRRRERTGTELAPATEEDPAMPSTRERIDGEARQGARVTWRHAAEPDVDGRRPGIEKSHQVDRRPPLRAGTECPVTRDVHVRRPIG